MDGAFTAANQPGPEGWGGRAAQMAESKAKSLEGWGWSSGSRRSLSSLRPLAAGHEASRPGVE